MYDGSLDCCATCWFNSNIQKEKEEPPAFVFCTIRNFKIYNGFTLFCANHPSHNTNMINVPIGSVYANSGNGKQPERKFLFHSPDTEKVRTTLVHLLNEISEDYEFHKFSETLVNEEIITQLSLVKEKRAIPGLLKLVAIDIESILDLRVQNNAIILIGLAIDALMYISNGEQLPNIEKFMSIGLENYTNTKGYDQKQDRLANIRYFTVSTLKYCNSYKATELLIKAQSDPNTDVRGLVLDLLKERVKSK